MCGVKGTALITSVLASSTSTFDNFSILSSNDIVDFRDGAGADTDPGDEKGCLITRTTWRGVISNTSFLGQRLHFFTANANVGSLCSEGEAFSVARVYRPAST